MTSHVTVKQKIMYRVIFVCGLAWQLQEMIGKKGSHQAEDIQKGKKKEQRIVKRRLKETPIHERAGLKNLLKDIKARILVTSRAEDQRKHRQKKRQLRRSFLL